MALERDPRLRRARREPPIGVGGERGHAGERDVVRDREPEGETEEREQAEREGVEQGDEPHRSVHANPVRQREEPERSIAREVPEAVDRLERRAPGEETDDREEDREAALERRLANRVRQLKLATRPDGTVHGGPDRATGDPDTINRGSAMYGTPDQIAAKLDELRDAGVGYVLVNGGGSGGGERGRHSMRRFAREVMPLFADQVPAKAAE